MIVMITIVIIWRRCMALTSCLGILEYKSVYMKYDGM